MNDAIDRDNNLNNENNEADNNSANAESAQERLAFVEVSKEERNWAAACHLGAFAGALIPLANIFVPLIIWLWKREEMPFVADQGKEALNFQLTLLILFLACMIIRFVFFGFYLLYLLGIVATVMIVIGAIKASEGVRYRYPVSLRLVV